MTDGKRHILGGKTLLNSGKVATADACCCATCGDGSDCVVNPIPSSVYASIPNFVPDVCSGLPALGGDYELVQEGLGPQWWYGSGVAPVDLGGCTCNGFPLDVGIWITFSLTCIGGVCHALCVVHIMFDFGLGWGEAQNWGFRGDPYALNSTSWSVPWTYSNTFGDCNPGYAYTPGSGWGDVGVNTTAP